jgi:hypothetical protein
MRTYQSILELRIAAFGEPSVEVPELSAKETAVIMCKTHRQGLDAILQLLKVFRRELVDPTFNALFDDPSEVIAQHTISIRDLESSIMRQGMALKYIGNPNPYPQSYDPTSTVVEPTADDLKL